MGISVGIFVYAPVCIFMSIKRGASRGPFRGPFKASPEQNRQNSDRKNGFSARRSQLEIASADDLPSHPKIAVWHCRAVSPKSRDFLGSAMDIAKGKTQKSCDFGALRCHPLKRFREHFYERVRGSNFAFPVLCAFLIVTCGKCRNNVYLVGHRESSTTSPNFSHRSKEEKTSIFSFSGAAASMVYYALPFSFQTYHNQAMVCALFSGFSGDLVYTIAFLLCDLRVGRQTKGKCLGCDSFVVEDVRFLVGRTGLQSQPPPNQPWTRLLGQERYGVSRGGGFNLLLFVRGTGVRV